MLFVQRPTPQKYSVKLEKRSRNAPNGSVLPRSSSPPIFDSRSRNNSEKMARKSFCCRRRTLAHKEISVRPTQFVMILYDSVLYNIRSSFSNRRTPAHPFPITRQPAATAARCISSTTGAGQFSATRSAVRSMVFCLTATPLPVMAAPFIFSRKVLP